MTARWVCRSLLCVGLMVGVGLKLGCDSGVGFLGLQDYQRDLLVGGLAAAALLGNQGGTADAPAEQFLPVEGPQGEQGTPGSDGGEGAAGEQGSVGEQGPQGPQGAEGAVGSAGPAGPSGASGSTGAQGEPGVEGPAGPSLFSVYVDDFFALVENPQGELEINLVSITEPALGNYLDRAPLAAIAFRVGIPQTYDEVAGNDVTMRLMFHRTGYYNGSCFIFRVDGRRLRNGEPVEVSGDTRYVRINAGDGVARGEGETLDVYLVVDLPINVAREDGLEYHVGDLKVADLLAFEIANLYGNDGDNRNGESFQDGGTYHLLGVEFFESVTADPGAEIFYDEADVCCVDCP